MTATPILKRFEAHSESRAILLHQLDATSHAFHMIKYYTQEPECYQKSVNYLKADHCL